MRWVVLWLFDVVAILLAVMPFLWYLSRWSNEQGAIGSIAVVAALAAATAAVPYGVVVARSGPGGRMPRAVFGGVAYAVLFLVISALIGWASTRATDPNARPSDVIVDLLSFWPYALALGGSIGIGHGLIAKRLGRWAANAPIVA